MNMDETAIYVNEKLKCGSSITKVEKELNYGKDTLRKKLNRAGYLYDKALKKFILDNNTTITPDITHTEKTIVDKHTSNKNNINPSNQSTEKDVITNSITHKKTHSEIAKNVDSEIDYILTQDITHAEEQHTTQNDNTPTTQHRAFTDEDFNILFEIIDNYKSKGDIKEKNITIPKYDSEITTRSFRSYKNVFDSFSKYCKDNELNQKDAIAEALISYISK